MFRVQPTAVPGLTVGVGFDKLAPVENELRGKVDAQAAEGSARTETQGLTRQDHPQLGRQRRHWLE